MRPPILLFGIATILNLFFWGFFISPQKDASKEETGSLEDNTHSYLDTLEWFNFRDPTFSDYSGVFEESPSLLPKDDWKDPEFTKWVDLEGVKDCEEKDQ